MSAFQDVQHGYRETQLRPKPLGRYVESAEEDPWNWTIERVGQLLCGDKDHAASPTAFLYPLDPEYLRDKLRCNGINGEAFLSLREEEMRDELGITLGPRKRISNLMVKLRSQSRMYQAELDRQDREVRSRESRTSSMQGMSRLSSPVFANMAADRPGRSYPPMADNSPRSIANDLPTIQDQPHHVAQAASPLEYGDVEAPSTIDGITHELSWPTQRSQLKPADHRKNETIITDEAGNKRRHMQLFPSVLSNHQASPLDPIPIIAKSSDEQASILLATSRHSHTQQPRHRNSMNDERSLDLESRNDATLPQLEGERDHTVLSPKPSESCRRLQPESLTTAGANTAMDQEVIGSGPTETAATPSQSILSSKTQRPASVTYMPWSAHLVDTIFYGDTELEGEVQEDIEAETAEFQFLSIDEHSRGHRQYVSTRLRHYFCCRRFVLDDRVACVGILPYPDRVGKRYHPLSATIFSDDGKNGISVSRSRRSNWAFTQGTKDATQDALHTDPMLTQDDLDCGNLATLEKWNHMDEDHILPIYGDSGSEGEYDNTTWREIEIEAGEGRSCQARPARKSLTEAEVQEALELTIQELSQEWTINQEPKLVSKARQYWWKVRQPETLHRRIQDLRDRLEQLDARILSMRTEIAKISWYSLKELGQKSSILQPSVFEVQEVRWKLNISGLEEPPAEAPVTVRPPRQRQDRSRQGQGEDAADAALSENALSQSDLGDTDMGDFIDDDDEAYEFRCIDHVLEPDDLSDITDTMLPDDRVDQLAIGIDGMKAHEGLKSSPRGDDHGHTVSAPANIVDLTLSSSQVSPDEAAPVHSHTESSRAQNDVIPGLEGSSDRQRSAIAQDNGEPYEHSLQRDDGPDGKGFVIPDPLPLPPLWAVAQIMELDPTDLMARQDRKRLLIQLMNYISNERRQKIRRYLSQSSEACRADIEKGLNIIRSDRDVIPGFRKGTSSIVLQLAKWFVCWTIPVKHSDDGVRAQHISTAIEDIGGFDIFREFLVDAFDNYEWSSTVVGLPVGSKRSKKRKNLPKQGSDIFELSDDSMSSQDGKQFQFASESQETISKREHALTRYREDEQRRRLRELDACHSSGFSTSANNADHVTVNPGRQDNEAIITLHPQFGRGRTLKPHQQEGLQFMWREITRAHSNMQGCLLAQTMGLGKTIQVLALLTTIAEASHSKNENVRNQVPSELRTSRTLILCPPALVENWWDECLLWPHEMNCLGAIRKINTIKSREDKLLEISSWNRSGGILLLGFHTFRDLVNNAERANHTRPSSDEQHRMVLEALLERPNIVIVDEAHEIKNSKASISRAMTRIQCKSRIALTGSPLSNNLREYYSLIDWIDPGYLGTYEEFRDVFEKPIERGLYEDSTNWEYREARKKLKALEGLLEPKVHRADMSALHECLKGKTEFLVRVPLTACQEKMYNDFLDAVGDPTRKGLGEAKVWLWLSYLQLLCNHPLLYKDRLVASRAHLQGLHSDRQEKLAPRIQTGSLSLLEESMELEDEPIADSTLCKTLESTEAMFTAMTESHDSLHLSNKMAVLLEIIKLSEAANDKVLIFSHRLTTLDYVGNLLTCSSIEYVRVDGKMAAQQRQECSKIYNESNIIACLISTRAGGQGLNFFGANRVVILDSHWNPMYEQQAVGRAYRIGQTKHVYVYCLTVAGTFEQEMLAQGLRKDLLAKRVVDKRNPVRQDKRGNKTYFQRPQQSQQEDLTPFLGKDILVLDSLLTNQIKKAIVSITLYETFYTEDGQDLTDQERREAEELQKCQQLRRSNPSQYQAEMTALRMRQHLQDPQVLGVLTEPSLVGTGLPESSAQDSIPLLTEAQKSSLGRPHSSLATSTRSPLAPTTTASPQRWSSNSQHPDPRMSTPVSKPKAGPNPKALFQSDGHVDGVPQERELRLSANEAAQIIDLVSSPSPQRTGEDRNFLRAPLRNAVNQLFTAPVAEHNDGHHVPIPPDVITGAQADIDICIRLKKEGYSGNKKVVPFAKETRDAVLAIILERAQDPAHFNHLLKGTKSLFADFDVHPNAILDTMKSVHCPRAMELLPSAIIKNTEKHEPKETKRKHDANNATSEHGVDRKDIRYRDKKRRRSDKSKSSHAESDLVNPAPSFGHQFSRFLAKEAQRTPDGPSRAKSNFAPPKNHQRHPSMKRHHHHHQGQRHD